MILLASGYKSGRELGIPINCRNRLDAREQTDFTGAADVLEFLAALPVPEDILALRPSPELQAQIDALRAKQRTTGLTTTEEQLWHRYQYLEHLVRIAKARALLKLKNA